MVNDIHRRIKREILEMQMIAHCFDSYDFNELDVKHSLESKLSEMQKLLDNIREGE